MAAEDGRSFATILAIGTSNPVHCVDQETFADRYFRNTQNEHMVELKDKMKRICEKSQIKKRYTLLDEETLLKHPHMLVHNAPSLDARHEIALPELPKLGMEAATKAIKEWGQPVSKITHLVFSTSSGIEMPGADLKLVRLLNLNPSVKRYMIYQQGCFSGGTILRYAKDLAETSPDARVLAVSSEFLSVFFFQPPKEDELDHLMGNSIFGDGAAAVIVGVDPDLSIERPLFQMISSMQTIIPGSDGTLGGRVGENGGTYYIKPQVPLFIGKNVRRYFEEAFSSFGIKDWNSLFYSVHPGGPAILKQVQDKLGLEKGKLWASEYVLKEYGNMGGPSVIFALDHMRKMSMKEGKSTTGDGLDWGALFSVGPGVTVEMLVLRSFPIVTTQY